MENEEKFVLKLSDDLEKYFTETSQRIELDFFRSADRGTYSAMAELELPASASVPSRFNAHIRDNLLWHVPRDNSQFSSHKLADETYSKTWRQAWLLDEYKPRFIYTHKEKEPSNTDSSDLAPKIQPPVSTGIR